MLVSGGQILAIDHVVKNDTLVGDGSTKPLGVNTDVIATTALVSATSAKLQDEIDAVSSNFDNYYTTNETSAASEISAALEGVIRHETEVSAADNTIDVSSETLPDGTVVYKIKAASNTNIIGVDPISAELREDGSWYITYHGSQGNIYNKGPNIDIYQVDDQWYISAAVPDVSNFLTSAVGHEGKALVLKDNVWVPADYFTDDDIHNLSATIANTYVSASIFNTYSASVKDKLDELTDVTDVVKETSAKWDEASAFAAHSADFMLSAKLNTFEKDGHSYISGYDNIPFFDKDTLYTGVEGIKVDIDTHEISISAKYLSANSLDDLSGKWESVYDTVDTNSAAWNAHSALSATKLDASESAKFMKIADLQSAPENTISGYGESAFYYPPLPEIPEYSGKDGIKVENYEISISANYLSANALDELSGKWEDTANTVSTASGSWNEVSGKQDILFLGDTLSGLGTSASPLQAKPIQIISNNGSITVSSNVSSGTSIFNIETVGATGVSGSSLSLAYTMPIAAATQNVSLNAGTSTQWAAHATQFTPFNDAILSSNSKIKISVPQVVSGGSLIFGLYTYSVDHVNGDKILTLKRCTNIITMPANYCYIEGTLENGISTNLNVSDLNYLVVLTNSNGCAVKGTAGNNANFAPYTSMISNNLGTLTAAPLSFKVNGETSLNIYAEIIF